MSIEFEKLPIAKQQSIIDAALEVFSKNEYKKANTEEIAFKANISKGSLFYYFKNKKELYIYIYYYVMDKIKYLISDFNPEETHDFFEIIDYMANKKIELVSLAPHILGFIMHCYLSQKEEISDTIQTIISDTTSDTFEKYFKNIDTSKFKDTIDPKEIFKILSWTMHGYLMEQQIKMKKLDIEDMMHEYQQ